MGKSKSKKYSIITHAGLSSLSRARQVAIVIECDSLGGAVATMTNVW